MPQQRVKRKFKDLSMSFETNPLNDDLVSLTDTSAIARSIRNIVMTVRGEKFFDENFGSRVSQLLFENIDDLTASSIQEEIEFSITNYEPRVKLLNVSTVPNFDEGSFDVIINYEIIGADVPAQELQFALQSTR